jgi:hypothetical protein
MRQETSGEESSCVACLHRVRYTASTSPHLNSITYRDRFCTWTILALMFYSDDTTLLYLVTNVVALGGTCDYSVGFWSCPWGLSGCFDIISRCNCNSWRASGRVSVFPAGGLQKEPGVDANSSWISGSNRGSHGRKCLLLPNNETMKTSISRPLFRLFKWNAS